MFEDPRRTLLEQAIEDGLIAHAAALKVHGSKISELYVGTSKSKLEYDLASLTKILCTTYLTAKAVTEKKLQLEERPWIHWPGVSIEHVLAHTSGLPAWREIANMEQVLAVKPVMKPGVQTLYSDIGFMALGALLEKRFSASLDRLYAGHRTHFHGQEPVDDANCRALGGVAGHSGLFGTLQDVYQEAQFFLKCLNQPETPLEKMLKKFAEYPGARALGFDKPTPGGSTGEALSDKSIGHLGFTGTSLWIDPVQQAIYILLTKRLDNGHRKEELLELRRKFHQF